MNPRRQLPWVLGCSVVGVALSSYLFYLHLGLLRGELLGGAACGGVGSVFNCHAVTAGRWGVFLGVPLSIWGLLGYLAVFGLALLGIQSEAWARRALTLIAGLAALFVAIDVVLAIAMIAIIRFYCLFCLMTYVVNVTLFLLAVQSLRLPLPQLLRQAGPALGALVPSSQHPEAALFWGVLLVGLVATLGLQGATTFVAQGALGPPRRQMQEFIAKQTRVQIETAGDPMHGDPKAPLQLVEFSDLLCPACQRASQLNTIILANHRHDAVLIFKHYPLDMTCNDRVTRVVHPGACEVAAAAECAHQQGRFWAFHDLAFRKLPYQMEHVDADAAGLGLDLPRFHTCMNSGQGMEAVKRDIAEGAKVGLNSTPTYVINGVQVTGSLNPTLFEEFIDILQEASH